MNSDFAAAQDLLDRALKHLGGNDETSEKAREGLEQVLEAMIVAQHSPPLRPSKVLSFPAPCRSRG